MEGINIWAVVVSAALAFILGGMWYSPIMFGKAWMKELKLTDEDLAKANMTMLFGLTFLISLVISFCLAAFLNDPSIGVKEGTMYGFLTGFGWVSMSIGMIYLFSRYSFKLYLIDAGYQIILYTLIGAILGAWK
jgi:hypothetical protein